MERTEPKDFMALDKTEQLRLQQLYDGLRQKLLDLTMKNRMLNYPLGARSKRAPFHRISGPEGCAHASLLVQFGSSQGIPRWQRSRA